MSELEVLDQGFADLVSQSEQPATMQQQQRPAHGMYIEFYMHPVEDKEKTIEQGRAIHREIPYIMIMSPGDKSSVIRRPVQTGNHPRNDNNRFHNEYVAFRQGLMAPVEGTPLAQWPQITRAQVLDLEHLGIRTVEHLANLNDGNAQKFMGLRDLKNNAINYLEATAGDAPMVRMQAELSARDNEIESLKNAMKELGAELAEIRTGIKKKE